MDARRLLPLLLIAVMNAAASASAQAHVPAPASPEASETLRADEDEAEAPLSSHAGTHAAPDKLRLELQQVEDERAHSSDLVPWLTVGVGSGTVLVSALAGAIHTLSCDPGCDTPNWVSFAVVAGAFVGTLGAIWLIHTDNGLRELESRRYQLQEELRHFEITRLRRDPTFARSSSAFNLRVAF